MTAKGRRDRSAPAFWKAIRSQAGAFDLPSIITGVVVVGILAAGVLAAIFGVIPFAQDKAAKQDLDAVRTAEGVAKSRLSAFMDKAGLLTGGLMSDARTVGVGADAGGTCYVGISKSATGRVYFSTDKAPEPKLLASGQDTGCIDAATRDEILDEIGGFGPAGPVADGSGADTDGDGIPNASDPDIDGDGTPNSDDPTPDGTGGAPVGSISYQLAGWGENYSGELGIGTASEVVEATALGTMTFSKISAGDQHSCGISDGKAYCWGDNWAGKIGNGAEGTDILTPTAVDTTGVLNGKTVTDISAGAYHTCTVADGAAYCWGYNHYTQTNGIPDSGWANFSPVAVRTDGVLGGKTLKSIIAEGSTSCALDTAGQAYCWGDTQALGDGEPRGSRVISAPVAVKMDGKSFVSLTGNNQHFCAIDTTSTAYCWGANSYGKLGIGSLNDSARSEQPTPITGLPTGNVTSITAGEDHTCAVAGGTAYCWGANWAGQLGNTSVGDSGTAVPVDTSGALSGISLASIETSDYTTCATSGTGIYCWGEGYMGDGQPYDYEEHLPIAVVGPAAGKTVKQLSLGAYNALFLYEG